MFAFRNALVVFICLLPPTTWAQGELSGERVLAAKLATVEREELPLDLGEFGEILPPDVEALGCAMPCIAGVLEATHPFYDVYLNCGTGAFTARTGVDHSVTLAAAGAPPERDLRWKRGQSRDIGHRLLRP